MAGWAFPKNGGSKPTSNAWGAPVEKPAAEAPVMSSAGGGFRAQDVRCFEAEVTADMFLFLGKKEETIDEHESEGKKLLRRVCDRAFIESLQKGTEGNDSGTLIKGEEAVALMNDQGFLPLGVACDEAFGGEKSLYVLVRNRGDHLLEVKPYLRADVWSRLLAFVGSRLPNRSLNVTLLTVDTQLLNRVIDFLFHDVEITSESLEEEDRLETLPIDVQPGEEGIIQLARYWLRESLNQRASDIHIEPMDGMGRIRIRVNGYLESLRDRIPLGDMIQMITWVKAQAKMNISERRRPLDGSMRMSYTDAGTQHLVDVRISVTPTIYGQKMVLRLLDPNLLKERSERGLAGTIEDPFVLDKFRKALEMRDGIVLVTGPTGSGKTTTLNVALLHLLNQDAGSKRNIVTVEDPVEYGIPGANQTQVNEAAGVTFASMLRSLLRQDPDVMLVGEIRDQETAQIAVQAALTGHLILSTLHTNDALGAIPRLEDLGVSRFLVGSTLRLVQAQRLVRRLCKSCGKRNPLSMETVAQKVLASRLAGYCDWMTAPLGEGEGIFAHTGCNRCNFSGFDSRVAVMEVVYSTPELVSGIERKIPQAELERIARTASGFRPMVESGIDMIRHGITDLGEIASICMGTMDA